METTGYTTSIASLREPRVPDTSLAWLRAERERLTEEKGWLLGWINSIDDLREGQEDLVQRLESEVTRLRILRGESI